jgi:hypothetical protein
MSQSVEARAMIIRMITIRPQMKAITYNRQKEVSFMICTVSVLAAGFLMVWAPLNVSEYVEVLISLRLFLFVAQPKELFLDGLKKFEQRSHKCVELRGQYLITYLLTYLCTELSPS